MRSTFALAAGFLYDLVVLVTNVLARKIGMLAYCLLVAINLIISIFVVSALRLHKSLYGVISWDGTHIVLSYRRGSLFAVLGVQHANAFAELEATFARTAIWLYSVQQDISKLRMASLIMNPGGMHFHMLKIITPPTTKAGSGNIVRKTESDVRIRKSKSVTFNENVEVHLITSSHWQSYQTRYLGSRYNFVNTFSPIPAHTFVQQC
ncbi:hypothetical protein X943_001021 [Babesia divergens]|uniref:Uncharacterized protein n=1 Tax=Babesia divergens TaxID=32595 RepID=A0AAD9GCS4_BABDI|nr:hypothetical protein X943_001021 [Babesia divergens]